MKPRLHPDGRWQPLRSGLVNLFKYDQEEFIFERGRMLLRGNNGTGKSRVLALQLPFLLDGETASHRVEPDGDPGKRFEWNLLMGKHSDRTGYTWIEFGRIDESGAEHYLTLGCGLKAVEGRGLVDKWFFVTSRRMGESLSLVSESSGVPFGREALEDALGAEGQIFRTAKEYRAVVDERLFRLGARRYEALVNLLIQLRKPQLSRDFNEAFLSQALSEALAPMDPEILAVIAEAYRGLDEDLSQLENFRNAHKAIDAFLAEYSVYARVASRRRAQLVRSAHSIYEEAQRDLKRAEEQLVDARERHESCVRKLEGLRQEQGAVLERIRTLETSPEMRSARELERAAEDASKAERRAQEAQRELGRAVEREGEALARKQDAVRRSEDALARLQGQLEALRASADAALLDVTWIPERGAALERFEAAQIRIQGEVARRRKAVTELEDLERAMESRERGLEASKRRLADAQARKTEVENEIDERGHALARATAEFSALVRSWLGGLRLLSLGESVPLLEELAEWCESPEGDSPLHRKAHEALNAFHREIDSRMGALTKELRDFDRMRAALQEERRHLETGPHAGPATRSGVNAARRAQAPGAPLWKVVEFSDELDETTRAGLEAALEAAGLLDAWLTPEGRVLFDSDSDDDDNEDILFDVQQDVPASSRGLTPWLRPAVDRDDAQARALSDDVVRRVLERIDAGPATAGSCWVDLDGSWGLGPLTGRWHKAQAQHVGQGARAAERRRRIQELDERLSALEGEALKIREETRRLGQARAESLDELERLPLSSGCSSAFRELEAARGRLAREDLKVQSVEREVIAARAELEAALREYTESAEAFGFQGQRGRLGLLREALGAFEGLLGGLEARIDHLRGELAAAEEAGLAHERAASDRERQDHVRQSLLEEAAKAQAFRDELQASVGARAAEVLARLEKARREAEAVQAELATTNQMRESTLTDKAKLDERVDNLKGGLSAAAARRDEAIASLSEFFSTGLLRTAAPELSVDKVTDEMSVTTWVELSRRIESLLSQVDSSDSVWERRSRAIYSHFERLQSALGALAYRAEGETHGEFFIVRVPFQQRACAVIEIEAIFRQEVEARQRLLEAREREIIENHLIGEISTHVHDRLHAAEEWVQHVNKELEERPTSMGMSLRFVWVVNEEAPAVFPEARRRLMRAAAVWSDEDRDLVTAFLHQRLQAERTANPNKSWFDVLASAFDYRAWHRFVVERNQEGRWQRLSKRTFGTGSGGEKALMLTMPQFAAAGAHYRSASPLAPRLILLDEAFVGIDNASRSNAMGLLTTFDLDLVMTSEREWGCYPTVPGIAIYQLAARAGVDAILTTRWVWDGSKRLRAEVAAPTTTAASSSTASSSASNAEEVDTDASSSPTLPLFD